MKTNLDTLFKTDKSKTIWLKVSDKVRFQVRPWDNPQTKQAAARHHKPHAVAIQKGKLSDETYRDIMAKIFVEGCLVDWEGVEIDGKEVPFERETAIKFFNELPELLSTLLEHTQDFKNFLVEETEAVGNS